MAGDEQQATFHFHSDGIAEMKAENWGNIKVDGLDLVERAVVG